MQQAALGRVLTTNISPSTESSVTAPTLAPSRDVAGGKFLTFVLAGEEYGLDDTCFDDPFNPPSQASEEDIIDVLTADERMSTQPELDSIAGMYRTFDEGFPPEPTLRPAQIRLHGDRLDILSLSSATRA